MKIRDKKHIKDPKSFNEQIILLKSRGIAINNDNLALDKIFFTTIVFFIS